MEHTRVNNFEIIFDGLSGVIHVNNKDKNNQEEPDHTNLTPSQVDIEGVKLSLNNDKKEVLNSPDQTNDKVTESTSANEHKTLLSDSPENTTIEIDGKPLEKVNASYNHNIYFSVRTSGRNYKSRLFLLMLTWFQVIDKDKVKYDVNVANNMYCHCNSAGNN